MARPRLEEQDAREILELYATGEYTYRDIAAMKGVSTTTVLYIVNKRTWKHLDVPCQKRPNTARIHNGVAKSPPPDGQVEAKSRTKDLSRWERNEKIRQMRGAGARIREIASEFGMSEAAISLITNRQREKRLSWCKLASEIEAQGAVS